MHHKTVHFKLFPQGEGNVFFCEKRYLTFFLHYFVLLWGSVLCCYIPENNKNVPLSVLMTGHLGLCRATWHPSPSVGKKHIFYLIPTPSLHYDLNTPGEWLWPILWRKSSGIHLMYFKEQFLYLETTCNHSNPRRVQNISNPSGSTRHWNYSNCDSWKRESI